MDIALKTMLDNQIGALERRIENAIAQEECLAAKARLLRSIPGVGPVSAAMLIAEMPELGRMTAGQAAAMTGLAPVPHDSGTVARNPFVTVTAKGGDTCSSVKIFRAQDTLIANSRSKANPPTALLSLESAVHPDIASMLPSRNTWANLPAGRCPDAVHIPSTEYVGAVPPPFNNPKRCVSLVNGIRSIEDRAANADRGKTCITTWPPASSGTLVSPATILAILSIRNCLIRSAAPADKLKTDRS
ncbi:transposase [Labrys portucalensis]|uniref:Transposase n=1 Tax=Labrys neptuniae TaxID=376174 RepID=A0ABV6ZSC8_9HYPH